MLQPSSSPTPQLEFKRSSGMANKSWLAASQEGRSTLSRWYAAGSLALWPAEELPASRQPGLMPEGARYQSEQDSEGISHPL